MKKQISAIFVLLALVLLGTAVSAIKAEGTGAVFAEGKGTFFAQGDGTVTVNTLGTTGIVWFKGAESVNTNGNGRVYRIGKWTIVMGNGIMTVSGDNISVRFVGSGRVKAMGQGFAQAHGRGSWKVWAA